MEQKGNYSHINSSSSKRIIKEEIDEGVVEAIVKIVVVVVEVDEEMETTTRIIMVVVEMEMVVHLKRNVEDVIEEEIGIKVVGMEVVVVGITMVEIPSKIMEEEEMVVVVEGIVNKLMTKHLDKKEHKRFLEGVFRVHKYTKEKANHDIDISCG